MPPAPSFSLDYNHENDYWTRQQGGCAVNVTDPETGEKRARHVGCIDLWSDDGPAHAANASAGETYEEYIFKAEAMRVLDRHANESRAQPLFLYYAAHVAHQPYEVPDSYNQTFSFIPDPTRQAYHAMVACFDDVLGEIVASFKGKQLWENTLMVMSTDNVSEESVATLHLVWSWVPDLIWSLCA